MITKEYLQQELRRRIDGIKPCVITTTDLLIGEMRSILVLVDALEDSEHLADARKTLEIKPGDEVTINGHKIVYDKDKGYVTIVKSEESVPNDLDFEQELYNHFGQIKDFTLGMRIGQYFYNLGRDSVPLPEDTVLFNRGVEEGKRLMMEEMSECFAQLKQVQSESINISAVREQLAYNRGASDERYKMRKKMIEEAIEYEVGMHGEPITINLDKYVQRARGIFPGDKVRVIVLPKED